MFKIEKGIPLTAKKYKSRIYPLNEMEVGDSFEVEKNIVHSVRQAITFFHRANPSIKFTTRATENGYRVWRVA